jgi:phosphoribosyl 1,2-cyclic phosphodiesterase
MLRFALLGSGSDGNGLIVEYGSTRLLIDCGFSVTETTARLARLGLKPEDLSAIAVTHEHADHIQGVERLARRFSIPVYTSQGTQHVMASKWSRLQCKTLQCTQPTAIGDLELWPYTVPHDAREPLQYVISNGTQRLGLLTDVGQSTPHIEQALALCDALVLEANHDIQLLNNNPRYPSSLKSRIRSIYGHLDNGSAQQLLSKIKHQRLQCLVAAHLSEDNNHPDIVRKAFSEALGCEEDWVHIAHQEEGFPWFTIQ